MQGATGQPSLCQNPNEPLWTLGVWRDVPVTKKTPPVREPVIPSGTFTRMVRPATLFFQGGDEFEDILILGDWIPCFQDTLQGEILATAQSVSVDWVGVVFSVPKNDGQSRQIMLRLYRFAGGSSSAPRLLDILLEGSQPVRALSLRELPSAHWDSPVLRVFLAREKDFRPFRTIDVFANLQWAVMETAEYPLTSRRMLDMQPFRYEAEEMLFTVQQSHDRSLFSLDVYSLVPPAHELRCPAREGDLNHSDTAFWTLKFNMALRRYSKRAAADENPAMLTVAASESREVFTVATVPFVIGVAPDMESRLVEILNLPSKTYFRKTAIANEGNLIALLDNQNNLLILERQDSIDPTEDKPEATVQWIVALEVPLNLPLRSLTVLHMSLHSWNPPSQQQHAEEEGLSPRPYLVLLLESGVLLCIDISSAPLPVEGL